MADRVDIDADDPEVMLVYMDFVPAIPVDHITLDLVLEKDGTVAKPSIKKPKSKPLARPKSVPMHIRAKKMTEQLYARNSVGCCLHIVTDDGNIEDSHVDHCVEYAKQSGHRQCYELAKVYQQMSLHERAAALDLGWCPKCEKYSCCGQCHGCSGQLEEPRTELQ